MLQRITHAAVFKRHNGLVAALLCGCLLSLSGCGQLAYRLAGKQPEAIFPNPAELPPASDKFVWSQVIDAVDDYFRIAREQPVQNSDGVLLDGRVETAYRTGSSILELSLIHI